MSPGHERDRVSELLYPFLVEETGVGEAEVLGKVRDSTLQKCREIGKLRRQVLDRHAGDLVRCAQAMAAAFQQGGKLLAFGNGGSATDAQDIAADFMSPPAEVGLEPRPSTIRNLRPIMPRSLPALSLTNDIAVVTAVGNDVGFDNIFARQVIALGRRGDIALGVTTSGASPNVIAALELARKQGLLTVGLSGYDGGKLATMGLDFCFTVASTYIPRIQEAQATIYHTLWELVQRVLESGP